jgi:hypothetical protein
MSNYKGLLFEPFTEDDIDIYSPIMKRSFDEDTKRHIGELAGGPDGYDNGEFLRKWYLHKDVTAFSIRQGDKPIGAIALWIKSNNENILGNIFIDVDLQDRGLVLTIWEFVENHYPNTIKWSAETPIFSRRNHNFYVNKCGFKIVKKS